MIPIKAAIEEQAWILVDNSDYSNEDDYQADEIRKCKFRFRPLELTKIAPASIDRQDEINSVISLDNLYLLKIDLVILSKEPMEGSPSLIFHRFFSINDSEGFSFKPVYDSVLCWSCNSEFAKRNGLSNFYQTSLFNPKIKYKAAILFELPDEISDLCFASSYSEISEV